MSSNSNKINKLIISIILCFSLLLYSCQEKSKTSGIVHRPSLQEVVFIPSELGVENDCVIQSLEFTKAIYVYARLHNIDVESHILLIYFRDSLNIKHAHAVVIFRQAAFKNIILCFIGQESGSKIVDTRGRMDADFVSKQIFAFPYYSYYLDDIALEKKLWQLSLLNDEKE